MHADYGPIALCISPDRQYRIESRAAHKMNLVWWYAGGYQVVLIGRNPASQLKQNALTLQAALSSQKGDGMFIPPDAGGPEYQY